MKIDDKKIQNSIKQGVRFLKRNQNLNGSICLNNDKTWDIWDTVHAIIALNEISNNKNTIDKAINHIKNSQRSDYSFFISSLYNKNQYCMETTPLCAYTLEYNNDNVEKIIDFIFKKQKSDGSWDSGIPEIYQKYQNFPSVTGQVVRTLLKLNIKNSKVERAIDWLDKKQLKDGSWGSFFVYYDTPFYPMHVILESYKLMNMENSKKYRRAINYIKRVQNKDGSWYLDRKKREKPSKEHRTSLALYCLLISPLDEDKSTIDKGIKWLLKSQKTDGSWAGGTFVGWPGKKEDIYATSTSILCMKKYLDKKF